MSFLNLWTRNSPFAEIRKDAKVALVLGEGRRPNIPSTPIGLGATVEKELGELLTEMWAHNPSLRPSSKDVQAQVEAIFEPS